MGKTAGAWVVVGALALLSVGEVGWSMSPQPAASAEVRLSQGRSNTAALQSAGHRYVVAATVRAVRPDDFLSRRVAGVRSQIADLVITIDGDPVAVPLSAIADGYDPGFMRMTASKTGVIVTISGSDGADGYSLEVTVEGGRVSRRRVLVVGDRVAEETLYHQVVVD